MIPACIFKATKFRFYASQAYTAHMIVELFIRSGYCTLSDDRETVYPQARLKLIFSCSAPANFQPFSLFVRCVRVLQQTETLSTNVVVFNVKHIIRRSFPTLLLDRERALETRLQQQCVNVAHATKDSSVLC